MATNKLVKVTVLPTRTGDTVASYNIYSDAQTVGTPIGTIASGSEATGTTVSLTDGLAHNITVKTVWTTAGESTTNTSNVVVVDLSSSSSYLFYEDFADALNLTTDWDLTNNNASTIFGVPNGEMEVIAGTNTTSYNDNYYLSQISAPLSSTEDVYGCIDIRSQGQEYSGLSFGLLDNMATKNGTRLSNTTAIDGYRFYSYEGGSLENDSSTLSGLDLSTIKTIKMAVTNNGANFDAWVWDGSAWVSLYTVTGLTTFNTDLKIHIGASGNSNYTDPYFVDNAYLTDTDFATQYPA